MSRFFQLTIQLLLAFALFFSMTPDGANAQEGDSSKRISGANRYETAVNISKSGWANGSETAILARGDLYPDALAGSPLAFKLNAPILLTAPDQLTEATKKELARLKVKNVILLGGEKALTNKVKTQVESLNIKVKRVSGSSRYETALKIAQEVNPAKEQVFIATGADFPDALAIAPYAAENGIPILLTAPKSIPANIEEFAKTFNNVTLIGGTGVIDPAIEKKFDKPTRISGKNRYETASKVIRELYDKNENIYISTGANFPDALTGSVLAAKNKTGILLTTKSAVPADAEIIFPQQQVKDFKVFGGTGVVEDKVITAFQQLLVKFEDTVGGGEVIENAKFLTDSEADKFIDNTVKVQTNDNGTLTYTLKNISQSQFVKDDMIFFPQSEDHPTGMIAKVLKSEKDANGNLVLQLGQPAIEDVFEDLNIQLDEELTMEQLVDMKLQEGVAMVVDDQAVNSFQEFSQLQNQRFLASDKMKLAFEMDLGRLLSKKEDAQGGTGSEDNDDFIVGETQKELKLTGSFEISNITPKAEIKKTRILKKWKSFDFGVSYDSTVNADLTGTLKGKFGLKNKTNYGYGDDDSWVQVEGVKRDDRLSLASFTFVPAPVVVRGAGVGDSGYKEVPVGITLFITTTFEGKFNVDVHIGYEKKDKTDMGIKWDKESNDFDAYRDITKVKNELTGDVKGAIAVTKKYGADAALNVGGLLPAVLENDFAISNTAKGEGYIKMNFLNGEFEKDGCVTNDFDISLQSRVKYRLAAKLWVIEGGVEGEYELAKLSIYKNKQEYCLNSGILKGEVKDAVTDQPIKDVAVTIYKDDYPVKTLKTDAEGKYDIRLFNGTYGVTYSKTGYSPLDYDNVVIDSDQVTHNPKMRLLSNEYINSPGSVGGVISNAINGQEIEGVTVNLRKGHNTRTGDVFKTATTDGYGEYVIEPLEAGYYTAELVKEGFTTTFIDIVAIGDQEAFDYHATLRPILAEDQISVVLTWGETPSDLDSHLTGPTMDGSDRFHIYYRNKAYYEDEDDPIASLDYDDRYSFGPETVTINKQTAGKYSYYVHNYSNQSDDTSTALSSSGAKVEVYIGSELIRTFHVPTTGTGTVWKVFDLSGTTITPVNVISGPGTTFESTDATPLIEKSVLDSFNLQK